MSKSSYSIKEVIKLVDLSISQCGSCCAVDRQGQLFRFMLDRADSCWTQIRLTFRARQVATGQDAIYCICSKGIIHKYCCINQRWDHMSSSGSSTRYRMSDDGKHMWALKANGDVFYSFNQSQTWWQVSGKLKEIVLSGDGQHLWVPILWGEFFFYRRGFHGNWIDIGGNLTYIAVSHDGVQVWGICKNGLFWTCHR